jgi:hypothetical protein
MYSVLRKRKGSELNFFIAELDHVALLATTSAFVR